MSSPAAPGAFVEPVRRRPLAWGVYGPRQATGLSLLLGGWFVMQYTSAYSFLFWPAGCALVTAGWVVLPGSVARRLSVYVPSMISGWLIFAGPDFAPAFAVILLSWLIVRQRPPLAYTVLVVPMAASAVTRLVFTQYDDNPASIAVMTLLTVSSAWLARGIAARAALRSTPTANARASSRGEKVDS